MHRAPMDEDVWTDGAIDLKSGKQLRPRRARVAVEADRDSDAVISGHADAAAGPAQPIAGVWLAWDDLSVDVDISTGFLKPKIRKTIVHQSRGRAGPGELLAVM